MTSPDFSDFAQPFRALVLGASGGIGGALLAALRAHPAVKLCVGTSRQGGGELWPLDVTDEAALQQSAARAAPLGPFSLIVNATGLLHRGAIQPEKRLDDLQLATMSEVFAVNALAPAAIYRHFVPLLATEGKAALVQLSARVGSISDNRLGGWYSYRAAKAAQNMFTKTAAIEVARRRKNVVLLGYHPGTVDTALSAPFGGSKPGPGHFSPTEAAGLLLQVVAGATPDQSGSVLAWDGSRVPE